MISIRNKGEKRMGMVSEVNFADMAATAPKATMTAEADNSPAVMLGAMEPKTNEREEK